MYDSFEPFKQLDIQEFHFQPNRFEIWENGELVNSGETNHVISATEKLTEYGKRALITITDSNLFQHISQTNDFDIFTTQNDRLQLVKVPSSGNGDENMGILMFKLTLGATREHTDFKSNEPYCCNLFLQDGRIAKVTFSFSTPEKLIEFYSDGESENDSELEFVFHSSDHIRYENGIKVSGPHGGAPRAIKVESNINGGKGYTVTLFNIVGQHASVQMAPKQMKIKRLDNNKIELIGFGEDSMGASFADYGLTAYHSNGKIIKCILHMFDRNIDIEYLE